MPKKRKSRGRSKGSKGIVHRIHCSACGALVPRDKAKRVTMLYSPINPTLADELKAKGAFIPLQKITRYFCISCAMYHGVVKARAREERKVAKPLSLA